MPDAALSAEDRLDVMGVLASYALCLDSGDVEGLLENFHADAVLDHIAGRAVGHAGIRQWAEGLMNGGRVGGTPAQLRHFVGLPYVEGDGERCTAQTYSTILTYDAEKAVTVPLVGSYHDIFTKREGRWRIQARTIKGDLGRAGRPRE